MADKQAHLNGAYYGPSIPTANYHRPSRSSGCGCGCCLLKLLLKIIISIVVIIGLAVLIFWLIFRPNEVKFHVTGVTLNEFNLDANNTMRYDLAVNITVRNPNRRIGIHYDRIEARAYYEDQRLHSETLTSFYQGHKNTSFLNPVFRGSQFVRLGADEMNKYDEERVSGIYSIDVKLYLRIRFKLGRVRTSRFRPRINCDLNVPLNSTTGTFFATKKCDWDY